MKNIFNKKSTMSVSTFIMSVIFISMFALGMLLLIDDSFSNYNVVIEAPFNNTQSQIQNNFNQFTSYANNTASDVTKADVSSSAVGLINIGSAYNAFKSIMSLPSILKGFMNDLLVSFGIAGVVPFYVVGGIIAMLLLYFGFRLLAALFRINL